MKKFVVVLLALMMALSLCMVASARDDVQEIIEQAQTMTLEELAKKAIEESNGKMFYGVGNSSRGKSALPLFIDYLKTIDPSYNMEFEWQQPKNNKIFDQLTADSQKDKGTFSMTLIQDGNQIESKMVQTGVLDTFVPKGWAEANGVKAADVRFRPLQTLNKVFMFNNTGAKKYTNCWDFVAKGEHGLFIFADCAVNTDVDSAKLAEIAMLSAERDIDKPRSVGQRQDDLQRPLFIRNPDDGVVLVAGGLDLVALSVLGLAKAGWLQVTLLIENANLGIARIARRDVSVQSNLGILEI